MLSLKVQKCDMLQKQKVANFVSLCQISNNLTRVPEHDISNFDALGKGKLPQTHVFPDMSIFRGRICLHDSASSCPTVGWQTVKERYWKAKEGISYVMLPTCLFLVFYTHYQKFLKLHICRIFLRLHLPLRNMYCMPYQISVLSFESFLSRS